jgi:DNA-binding LacI/PurR family transcriptional regulator
MGARAALRNAGIASAAGHVVVEEPTVAGGQRAAASILAVDAAVTAIVAYNDLMAIGAMRAVRAGGGRVPDDVSVVGFDDVDLAAFVDPPLTTVAQQTGEMGRWAVDQLTSRLGRSIRGGDPLSSAGDPLSGAAGLRSGPDEAGSAATDTAGDEPAPHVVLPVRLVVRGSTGPAPGT